MRNLFKFILRYSNFLVFLILEVVAFLLLVNNNEFPKSSALSTANEIVASYYQTMSSIGDYFSLRRENDALAAENAALRNQLLKYQNIEEDSIEHTVYAYSHLQLHHIPAKVVNLTTDRQHNFITLNKGSRDGVRKGFGVCDENGAVGVVSTVGENFSIVVPLIHTSSAISCRIKKNDYIGAAMWDGKNYRYAKLDDVAAHVEVEEGDTIVTSGLTPVFPEGILVGVVQSAKLREGDSYYSIRVRLASDFKRLKYVEIIDNSMKDEQIELENGSL